MRGQILGYDQLTGEGAISGEDGTRYVFKGTEWKGAGAQLRTGTTIDFEVADGVAVSIFPAPGQSSASAAGGSEKSHIVAGLFALFLGTLGVHKFYLGYTKEGAIMLATTVVSWLLLIVIIGFFGLIAVSLVAFVEAIIYLAAGQEKFDETYVRNHKGWF